MTKTTHTLIPELRFPEFMNEEEWDEKTVSQVAEYENGKAHEQDIVEQGMYVVVNSKFISTGGEVRKFSNNANCVARKNDVLMVLSDVPNGRAIAKCFYVDKDDFYTVNQRICKITSVNSDGKFLHYVLNRNQYFLAFDDGVKQTNLRNEDVLNCPIIIPKNPNEQQKIASCLSSLDEVIAAHTQKLELLKDHKKGLMQNLFPQEGEKVPKYRFPEFVNQGEWKADTLINLARFRRGSFPQPYGLPEWYDDKNGMPFIQVYDVSDNFLLKSKTKSKISKIAAEQSVFIPQGTVIITIQGSIGRVAITQYDAYIDRTLLLFEKFYNEIDKTFFAYVLFLLFEIEKEKAPGGIIKTITKEVLSEFVIKIPKLKEQQRIASCLSSLDALITAQAEKVEQLKLHKKGLMQGLFPKVTD